MGDMIQKKERKSGKVANKVHFNEENLVQLVSKKVKISLNNLVIEPPQITSRKWSLPGKFFVILKLYKYAKP